MNGSTPILACVQAEGRSLLIQSLTSKDQVSERDAEHAYVPDDLATILGQKSFFKRTLQNLQARDSEWRAVALATRRQGSFRQGEHHAQMTGDESSVESLVSILRAT